MQVELPEQSNQSVQTKGASNPKSSNILQTAIDLWILGDSAEELTPAEDDDEDLFKDLLSIFDLVEDSGVELKPTKCDEELLKELTNVDDLKGLEDIADEWKPPKADGDFLKNVISFYDLSNCEENGDKLKPRKADDEDRCDSEFDSLRKNKDMAQGTYQKRKLPSKHIKDHVDDFSSNNEIEHQPLKKKKKATDIQEKSQQIKSNSHQNNKEKKPLLEKRTRWAKNAKTYRINKMLDRRLIMEDISKCEKDIAALEKEISYYKLLFSNPVVTQQDGSLLVNKGPKTQTQLQQPIAALELWFQ